MTFLKKLGLIVLKVVNLATGLFPLLSQTPVGQTATGAKVIDRLSQAFGVITTAEQMFAAANGPDAKTGSQKLAASSPFVGSLIQEALADFVPAGAKPKDEAAFLAAVKTITGGLADALNSYGE